MNYDLPVTGELLSNNIDRWIHSWICVVALILLKLE